MDKKIKKVITETNKVSKGLKFLLKEDKKRDKIIGNAKKGKC